MCAATSSIITQRRKGEREKKGGENFPCFDKQFIWYNAPGICSQNTLTRTRPRHMTRRGTATEPLFIALARDSPFQQHLLQSSAHSLVIFSFAHRISNSDSAEITEYFFPSFRLTSHDTRYRGLFPSPFSHSSDTIFCLNESVTLVCVVYNSLASESKGLAQ